MSDSQIAEYVGVNDKTVGKYREELESSSELPKIDNRTVTRGKSTYQQNTTNIGGSKARDPEPEEEPDARRKAGDTLGLMKERGELAERGRPEKKSQAATFTTLDDLGLTRSQSSRYQQEASVSEADYTFLVVDRVEARFRKIFSLQSNC